MPQGTAARPKSSPRSEITARPKAKLLIDREIKAYVEKYDMLNPFSDKLNSDGVISWGLSSMGYDIRIADEFKIFTNVWNSIVDPKKFDQKSFVDFKGKECVIPPNSFALARTVEYFKIPRNVLTVTMGKCLAGDTRVVDANTGEYLPIRDFVAQRRCKVLSLGGWELGRREATGHLNNGFQPVFELTTRSGLRVKATATHPFRTFSGWIPLSELRPGARIAAARSCPVFGNEAWPKHEAVLLGLLMADGQCDTPGSSPRYTTDDPTLIRAFADAAEAFGSVASPVGRMSYNLVNRQGRGGVVTRNRAALWLKELGCNVLSIEKSIPQVVFRARRESVRLFLSALFSGDGSAYASGACTRIEYGTSSERLASDVRHLLLRFGVFSTVRPRQSASGRTAYRVSVTDKEMIRRFAREIGFLPGCRKQQALEDLLVLIALEPRRKSNFDTLPPAAWGVMRQAARSAGVTLSDLGLKHTNPAQSLPYGIATEVADMIGEEEFTGLVNADVVWDTVESIVPAGVEEVYDLTVPGTHNFVANDLVVHNSTYARCGLIVNVTPFEPEWEGYAVLEVSNTTPLPAKIYANEGIAQVLFFASDEPCEVSYKDRKGKYQAQKSIVLPKILNRRSS